MEMNMNAEETQTAPLFATWKFGGLKFLAARQNDTGTHVVVVDEQGRGYGSWNSIKRFRDLQRAGNDYAQPLMNAGYRLLVQAK
jgi:hypothetical protein